MSHCHIDIESYSEVNLKTCGLYKYAESDSTEILVVCYAFDSGPVNLWIPLPEVPRKVLRELTKKMEPGANLYVQEECPRELCEHATQNGQFRAHNSQFERVMLNGTGGKKIGFPATTIQQWVCTAAKAAAHSVPRQLGMAAKAMGTYSKDELGKIDMLSLCKPRTGVVKRYTLESDPDKYIRVYTYCMDDVRAERGIDIAIPDLSPLEQRVFRLDQHINDRGVRVDMQAVQNVQVLIAEYKSFLEEKCREWTGVNPTQTAKLADWVRERYPSLQDLQAATIKEAIADEACTPEVKKVLRLRATHSMKAVSKYDAIERAITADGHLRGMFMYHGAGTGRWSSLIVQLQNLFRPVISDPDTAIDAFAARDLEWIRALYTQDPMRVFASCVRGMLIPEEDEEFIAMDFSSIEARVLPWIAGQYDMLAMFREHGLMYEYTAAKIYKMHPVTTDVLKSMKTEHPQRRFVGKIAVLALGYQGGKKAFAGMAKQQGVDISEEEADRIKDDWRASNPQVVSLWRDMEEAARGAVRNPGRVYSVGGKKIMFKVEGRFLYMRLSSGRRLAYLDPEVDVDGKVTYYGIDTYTRQWGRVGTYGGKLTENAVQAISRDLLVSAMFKLEDCGYRIVGTVHDEVILSVPVGFGSEEEVEEIMCDIPSWAEGLPVAAEGWRGPRYKKG